MPEQVAREVTLGGWLQMLAIMIPLLAVVYLPRILSIVAGLWIGGYVVGKGISKGMENRGKD